MFVRPNDTRVPRMSTPESLPQSLPNEEENRRRTTVIHNSNHTTSDVGGNDGQRRQLPGNPPPPPLLQPQPVRTSFLSLMTPDSAPYPSPTQSFVSNGGIGVGGSMPSFITSAAPIGGGTSPTASPAPMIDNASNTVGAVWRSGRNNYIVPPPHESADDNEDNNTSQTPIIHSDDVVIANEVIPAVQATVVSLTEEQQTAEELRRHVAALQHQLEQQRQREGNGADDHNNTKFGNGICHSRRYGTIISIIIVAITIIAVAATMGNKKGASGNKLKLTTTVTEKPISTSLPVSSSPSSDTKTTSTPTTATTTASTSSSSSNAVTQSPTKHMTKSPTQSPTKSPIFLSPLPFAVVSSTNLPTPQPSSIVGGGGSFWCGDTLCRDGEICDRYQIGIQFYHRCCDGTCNDCNGTCPGENEVCSKVRGAHVLGDYSYWYTCCDGTCGGRCNGSCPIDGEVCKKFLSFGENYYCA